MTKDPTETMSLERKALEISEKIDSIFHKEEYMLDHSMIDQFVYKILKLEKKCGGCMWFDRHALRCANPGYHKGRGCPVDAIKAKERADELWEKKKSKTGGSIKRFLDSKITAFLRLFLT